MSSTTKTGHTFRNRIGALLLAAGLTSFSASAITYTDIDEWGLNGIALDSNSATATPSTFTGIFDIRNGEDSWDQDGFNPATQDATSGWVGFLLGTDQSNQQEFRITLDDLEVGTQYINGIWASALGLSADLLVEISNTGTLSYKITALSGSFNLYGAALEVEATNATSVPDGGATAMLLGLGMLGVASVRGIRRS